MLLHGIFYFRIHLPFIWLILVFLEFFVIMLTFNLRNQKLDQSVGYLRKVFLKEFILLKPILICMECSYMNCYFEKYHFLKFIMFLMFPIVFKKELVQPFSMILYLKYLWISLLNVGLRILMKDMKWMNL